MAQVQKKAPAKAEKRIPFKEMTGKQKFVFICKLSLSIVSFGFIYPNITS